MKQTHRSFTKQIVCAGIVVATLAGINALAADPSAPPVQPVKNGTFDKWTGGKPNSWAVNGEWKIIEEEMNKFARLEHDVEPAQFLDQTVTIPEGWKKIVLMARLRVKDFGGNTSGCVQVYAKFLDNTGTAAEGSAGALIKVQESTDGWQAFKTDPVAIPEGAKRIKIGTGMWVAMGTMDVDDIALVESKE
jgi:hypothetical protein